MNRSKPDNGKALFQEERLARIVEVLNSESRLVTNELMKRFNTTSVTIRKDLEVLEQRGLLKRTHGGAVKAEKLYPGLALNEKEKINLEEKLRIVRKAAQFITEGDTIILDSGSTTSLLAKEIRHMKNLTVITNAINIANDLLNTEIAVILIGGSLLKDTSTLVGPLADETLKLIAADKLFMGVDGFDFDTGLTTPNINEAMTSRVMMKISSETIVVVDASKFGRRSLGVISKVKEVDKIITTKKLSEADLANLSQNNIEVFVV